MPETSRYDPCLARIILHSHSRVTITGFTTMHIRRSKRGATVNEQINSALQKYSLLCVELRADTAGATLVYNPSGLGYL